MPMCRRSAPFTTLVSSMKLMPLAAAVTTLLLSSNVYAATFGHARVLSKAGQTLAINIPVSSLTDQDLATLKLAPAPAADWSQAGLTPPVELTSLNLKLTDGMASGQHILKVRSSQVFNGNVADLLLDVGTASGQQRYQVSLLTQSAIAVDAAATGTSFSTSGTGTGSAKPYVPAPLQNNIQVKRGDTLFSLARKNAVSDVTVYQMMVAMHRANPQAFIHSNMNLLRAGVALSMPDASALTALSDAQARRVFQQHADAFAKYRQGKADNPLVAADDTDVLGKGTVVRTESAGVDSSTPAAADQLRLSGANAQQGANNDAKAMTTGGGAAKQQVNDTVNSQQADNAVATSKGIAEAESRVSQLEENVKNLNQAFKSQGEAATELVLEGAKGIGQSLSDMANSVVDATGIVGGANQVTGSTDTTVSSASAASTTSGASTNSPSGGSLSTAAGASTGGAPSADNMSSGAAPVANASSAGATNTTNQNTNTLSQSETQKAAPTVSWLLENFLVLIGGGLALIVLLVVWLLRRASSGKQQASGISPAMVQQKLDEINLDLTQPDPNSTPNKSV